MYLSLGQAAKEAGKSKSVISNALHSGRLSGRKNDKGGWEIDPAELFRVFAKQNAQEREKEQNRTPENPAKNALLEQEVRHLREQLDREREINRDLIRRLDAENEERRKLTLLLTDQRATAPQKLAEGILSRTWGFLRGKA
jgi:molecular chaperone GrpE (heat shock protein)